MSSFKIISKKRSAGSNTLHTLTYNEYGFSPPGIDGKHAINNLISCRYDKSTELFKKDLYAHYGCVNAIEFSQDGKLMISGGDDRRVLLWNVEKGISGVGKPVAMRGEHHSNIFCLAFDSAKNRVFSGSNDEQLIVHDAHTGELLKVLSLGDAVYCISVDPSNDNAFAAACENGRIYMFDCRESYNQDNMPILISKRSAFHAVQHNPLVPNLLVTANSKKGVTLWDLRWPRNALLKYNCGLVPTSSAMSVQFNSRGTQIAALRRRLPPILYNVGSPHPIAEFEHNDYYNSCTMKTCCFAGPNDEFVLSGSDDFKLYVWKIPENLMKSDMNDESCQWVDKTHLVLSGHRSIVNHVRYNSPNAIIASSGVEKIIKVWSPFNISDDNQVKTNSKRAMQNRRHIYSNEEYLSLILDSADALSSNDSNVDSVAEDPKMIAFFDTLVQRDIMGASSESDGDPEDETLSESSMTRLPFENPAVSDSNEDEDEIGNISPDEQPDLMQTLDPRSIDYIEKFCDRMNSMTQKLSNGEVSRNFAGYSLSMVSPIKLVRDLRDSQSDHDSRDFYFNDKRGISNKMLEKKKEQLRKHARSALRVMRFRLHKLRKILSKKKGGDSTSDADEVQVLKEQLEHVMKLLESVSCRSDRSSREERRTLRARLRSLTYTSRNDFLRSPRQPIEIDSSDSDGSLQAGFLNLQNLLSNEDTQSSNNSSSQIRSPDSNHAFNDFESDDPSEPGDADDDDDDVDGGENDGTNHRSGPILDFKKFNLKLNYDTSDSDSSSDSDSDSENDSTPPDKSRDTDDGDILEPAQSRMCLDEQQPSDSNQATNVSSHDSNGDINDVHKTSKKSTDPSLLFDMQANGETASTIPEPGPSNNRECSTNQQEPSISFFKNVKNDSSSKRCFRKRRINDETGSNCEKNSKNLRIT